MAEKSQNANKHVYILPELHTALKLCAVKEGKTLTDYVNTVLQNHLNSKTAK